MNNGFFRRLLNGELPCKKAASLSAQQMASKELSFWASLDEKSTKKTASKCAANNAIDILGLIGNDTTDQHKSHLFDLNCKICTGKQKEAEMPRNCLKSGEKVRYILIIRLGIIDISLSSLTELVIWKMCEVLSDYQVSSQCN